MSGAVMMFIDGTWLWHSRGEIVPQVPHAQRYKGFKIDYTRLPEAVISLLNYETKRTDIHLLGVHYFSSVAENMHHQNEAGEKGRVNHLDRLSQQHCYTLHLSDQDFGGEKVGDIKRKNGQVEKMVDVDMAVEMTDMLRVGPAYEWAVVLTGDLDLAPAMRKQMSVGRKVVLVSIKKPCNIRLGNPSLSERYWHKRYWLDNMVPQIMEQSPLRQRMDWEQRVTDELNKPLLRR